MDIKFTIKKYGIPFFLFVLTIFISGVLDKLFEPLYTYLINASNTSSVIYIWLADTLSVKVPVSSILVSIFIMWIIYRIYRFFRLKYSTLKIIKATYGYDGKVFDITQNLNDSVQNNKLIKLISNDIAGDPYFGKIKTAQIKYQWKGEILEKNCEENQTIQLP